MVIPQIEDYQPKFFIEARITIHMWDNNNRQMCDLTKYGTNSLGSYLHCIAFRCNNNINRYLPRSNLFLHPSEDIQWLITCSLCQYFIVYQIFRSIQPLIMSRNRRNLNNQCISCGFWWFSACKTPRPVLVHCLFKIKRLFIQIYSGL
ncbi:hypothetical protein EYC80_002445 [Monilinia laxa]|uniref:Uncharacterized protein n=1 Tax=Monilinia laxa TaxID=61186 RepID=A0A5N6K3X4_MONLA|nr:hypothetical protein EYC80_002445 [Monilinia laxa]